MFDGIDSIVTFFGAMHSQIKKLVMNRTTKHADCLSGSRWWYTSLALAEIACKTLQHTLNSSYLNPAEHL